MLRTIKTRMIKSGAHRRRLTPRRRNFYKTWGRNRSQKAAWWIFNSGCLQVASASFNVESRILEAPKKTGAVEGNDRRIYTLISGLYLKIWDNFKGAKYETVGLVYLIIKGERIGRWIIKKVKGYKGNLFVWGDRFG